MAVKVDVTRGVKAGVNSAPPITAASRGESENSESSSTEGETKMSEDEDVPTVAGAGTTGV